MFCILWHLSFWRAISFTSFHIWCLLVSFVCPSVYRVSPVLYCKIGACICTVHTTQLHIDNALRGYGSLCTVLELCLSDAVFTCNIIHLPGVPMLMQCIQNHLKSGHLCVGGVGKVSIEYTMRHGSEIFNTNYRKTKTTNNENSYQTHTIGNTRKPTNRPLIQNREQKYLLMNIVFITHFKSLKTISLFTLQALKCTVTSANISTKEILKMHEWTQADDDGERIKCRKMKKESATNICAWLQLTTIPTVLCTLHRNLLWAC